MSIVLRQEKAKAWLAAKFNGLSVGPLVDGKYCIELDGAEHVIEFPDRRILMHLEECQAFLHGGKCVFLYGWTMNPYLADVIAFLSRKFPKEMAEVARAFGVERIDCTAEGLPTEPCILIGKLPDVEPDGSRTVFELMADAIEETLRPKRTPEEREKIVKRKLKTYPHMTAEELRRQLGCSVSTVVRTQAWQENQKKLAACKAKAEAGLDEKERLNEAIMEQEKAKSNRQHSQVFSGRKYEAKTEEEGAWDDNSDDDNIDDC
jgi:hypothetical protein